MLTLVEQLSQYARYHRDQRNIATHLVGVPMIVAGVGVLLGRPAFEVGNMLLTPAIVVATTACLYYLFLSRPLGLIMTVLFAAAIVLSQTLASGSTMLWLGSGLGLFVIGWIVQFVGHYYEGQKPAFTDDLVGLAIGPLFVVAEACFKLGLFRDIEKQVIARAGPNYLRDLSRPAAEQLPGLTETSMAR